MELDILFALISMFFIGMTLFFIFKAPKFADKLEAILVCALGFFAYGFLSGMYNMGEPKLVAIFFMAFLYFLWGVVFFSLREPRVMKKKQAIAICLFGTIAYGLLCGAAYMLPRESKSNEIVQDTVKKSNNSPKQTKAVETNKNIDENDKDKDDKDKDKDNDKGSIIGDTDSKIYHVPGSTYYEKEKKKESNNVYFKTIEEATKAGYRAPKK